MAASPSVLRVGTYNGIPGQYKTIEAAVKDAKPNDIILVAPGDYKTTSSLLARGSGGQFPAGVLITTPDLTLRGMNRNTVIVDGSRKGPACNDNPADQNFGRAAKGGPTGLNGIMVWKADDVTIENLTACNFLGGSGGDGDTGNAIWWNGGANSGAIGGWGYAGSYLNATSGFFDSKQSATKAEQTAAEYGIFSSNWSGGTWNDTYTSNMNDSGYYIGACQQFCDQTIDHAWGEFSALGYSGTNSGGTLVVENSQFDNNEEGFDTNSQNDSDWPSPQDGACPDNGTSKITHTHSCWVFIDNDVHDNNNPNVPAAGTAALAPVGTGISLEGRDDTVIDNVFKNNGAWGVVFEPFPDTETPPSNVTAPCHGGIPNFNLIALFGFSLSVACLYDDWNDRLVGNTFTHEGFFANPSNGDFAEATWTAGHPTNCYQDNRDTSGTLTSSPASLQANDSLCGVTATAPDNNPTFAFEAICDTEVFGVGVGCPPGASYPRRTKVVMHPLPTGQLPTMPNPCDGVPANPWCPSKGA
ncbi:MAG: hypothetical protein ACLP0J_26625 [Solirubrobacteraceae bacterium]